MQNVWTVYNYVHVYGESWQPYTSTDATGAWSAYIVSQLLLASDHYSITGVCPFCIILLKILHVPFPIQLWWTLTAGIIRLSYTQATSASPLVQSTVSSKTCGWGHLCMHIEQPGRTLLVIINMYCRHMMRQKMNWMKTLNMIWLSVIPTKWPLYQFIEPLVMRFEEVP